MSALSKILSKKNSEYLTPIEQCILYSVSNRLIKKQRLDGNEIPERAAAELAAKDAQIAEQAQEIERLKLEAAHEVDEFNMEVEHAEIIYRNALPDGVFFADVFKIGYVWAMHLKGQS